MHEADIKILHCTLTECTYRQKPYTCTYFLDCKFVVFKVLRFENLRCYIKILSATIIAVQRNPSFIWHTILWFCNEMHNLSGFACYLSDIMLLTKTLVRFHQAVTLPISPTVHHVLLALISLFIFR